MSLQKKLILYILLIIGYTGLTFMPGCSRGPSPAKVMRAYESAVNSHNINSIVNCYSDDIVFEMPGVGPPIFGKDAVRGLAEYDSVLNTNWSITIGRIKHDSVFCGIRESNDWLSAARLSSSIQTPAWANFYSPSVFVVRNGKIESAMISLSDSSISHLNEIMSSLVPWAQQNRPEEYASMISDGAFVYSGKNAQTILVLLKEWKESTHAVNAAK
jgi:hypothetical protein